LKQTAKTLVQCDFDGTATDKDVSFLLLDAFASRDWRRLFQQYQEGKMTVGRFNAEAFAMVTAGKETLLEHMKGKIKIRTGFRELVAYCREKDFRFVIVSNGLDFYIEKILGDIGMTDLEVFSAQTRFGSDGLKVQYIGPDGIPLDSDFKEAYVDSFLEQGYRIIYAGNGDSDLLPARRCHHVFATGTLLALCKQTNLDCIPFTDFHQVVRAIENLQ